MSEDAKAKAKQQAAHEERRRYRAFLGHRIPELHAAGVPGRLARTQADEEYVKLKRGEAV